MTLRLLLLCGQLVLCRALYTSGVPLHVRRQLLSQSTTYCYLNSTTSGIRADTIGFGCGEAEPQSVDACEVGAQTICALGSNHNGVDANRWFSDYSFDHCEEVIVYVKESGNMTASESYYCKRLGSTGDWSTRRRESAGMGVPESDSTSWWWCGWWGSGFEWHDGRCRSSRRFLGEACWDDSGECFNEGAPPYSGLHMSCATMPSLGISSPTCIPSAFEIERNSCQCGWFDWWLGVACGAADGTCNGHACVWSTGSGEYTCDYATDNNW